MKSDVELRRTRSGADTLHGLSNAGNLVPSPFWGVGWAELGFVQPTSGSVMKLYTFRANGPERVGAATDDGDIVDLALASRNAPYFADMMALIEGGDAALEEARAIVAAPPSGSVQTIDSLTLAAPIPRPRKIRGFSVFEAHLKQSAEGAARRLAAAEADPEAAYVQIRKALNLEAYPPAGWYETPAYYYMDHDTVVGHDSQVTWPAYSDWIDFELEIAAVIGRTGRDVAHEEARGHIFGYSIINDLSARDAQLKGMATGLGWGKGKDFDGSNPMGPCIVTADEIEDPYSLSVRVLVNGDQWSSSVGESAQYSFDECIAFASQAQTIHAGEIISTGTLPSCSSLELMRTVRRGDTIELEVTGIGTLRSRIK